MWCLCAAEAQNTLYSQNRRSAVILIPYHKETVMPKILGVDPGSPITIGVLGENGPLATYS
jgi:hypothetical protein